MSRRLVFFHLFCALFLTLTISPGRFSAQSIPAAPLSASSTTAPAPGASSISTPIASPAAAATASLPASPLVPSTPSPQALSTPAAAQPAPKGSAVPKGTAAGASTATSRTTDSASRPRAAAGTDATTAPSTEKATRTRTFSDYTPLSSLGPPDVHLKVPNLSVKRIELDVDNLKAEINLNANVAGLVSINAGVAVGIKKINLTIADVEAKAELIVRLGHLVEIVNRVFSSLDLNPLLITALDTVTGLVDTVVGAVDGLLGSITQGGSTLSFLVDNLGNIVQQVTGAGGGSPQTSIVGNYLQNMTYTGVSQNLQNGLVKKTYQYTPLNALVDIVFNTAGNIVQATVVNQKPKTPVTGPASSSPSPPPPPPNSSAGGRASAGSPVVGKNGL